MNFPSDQYLGRKCVCNFLCFNDTMSLNYTYLDRLSSSAPAYELIFFLRILTLNNPIS